MLRAIRPMHDGQITIPDEFQRELGIGEDSALQLTVVDGELRIRPLGQAVGPAWVERVYDLFAPVREEAIERGYTEEEINEAIDEAITAVRGQRD